MDIFVACVGFWAVPLTGVGESQWPTIPLSDRGGGTGGPPPVLSGGKSDPTAWRGSGAGFRRLSSQHRGAATRWFRSNATRPMEPAREIAKDEHCCWACPRARSLPRRRLGPKTGKASRRDAGYRRALPSTILFWDWSQEGPCAGTKHLRLTRLFRRIEAARRIRPSERTRWKRLRCFLASGCEAKAVADLVCGYGENCRNFP